MRRDAPAAARITRRQLSNSDQPQARPSRGGRGGLFNIKKLYEKIYCIDVLENIDGRSAETDT